MWLLLELVAAAQVPGGDGESSLLGRWIAYATSPLDATASGVVSALHDARIGLVDIRRAIETARELRRENQAHRAEILLLRHELTVLADAARSPLLGESYVGSVTRARCTYRNLAAGEMVVSAGRRDGVRPDTAAVGAEGVIGRVVTAGERSARLELVTHPTAAIGVRSSELGIEGLAVGAGRELLQVHYIPKRAPLVRGTLLRSSGSDGIYPPGLPVARVVSVRESGEAFLEVLAAVSADLPETRVVLLLTGLDPEPGFTGASP